VAAPTPASDGKLIFAFFSSNDLVCLDLEGNLKWFRGLTFDYPTAANDVGMSSSPIVVGQTVVVQVENKTDSFAAGLDTATGETRWRIDREPEMNWTSPAVLRGKTPADDLVLLQSTTGLTLNDPMTGKEVWNHKATCSGIPSVSSTNDFILLPAAGLTALRYKPGTDKAESVWTSNQLGPGNSSPMMQDGKVYVVNRTGTLTCGDATNGAILWRVRMKGTFWASPVIAGGYLYGVSQDGDCQVVRLGDKGEIVSENKLGEPVFSSPAVADDALYIRTDGSLWKIARQP
jgi:outer membrane protein assembly factor BamB